MIKTHTHTPTHTHKKLPHWKNDRPKSNEINKVKMLFINVINAINQMLLR